MDGLPQLAMRREGLTDLPRMRLEFGYLIRTYRPGDDVLWCSIMEGSIGTGWTPERFGAEIFGQAQFDPCGLFFATIASCPAGTACAWRATPGEERTGTLHMVAVMEEHRGKGIGRFLTLKVLEYFRDTGFEACNLTTDDWRIPAIKSYLAMGFRPEYSHESHRRRWEEVMRHIGRRRPEPV